MATVYRAYHTRREFEKYRIFTVHVALLVALAVTAPTLRANDGKGNEGKGKEGKGHEAW